MAPPTPTTTPITVRLVCEDMPEDLVVEPLREASFVGLESLEDIVLWEVIVLPSTTVVTTTTDGGWVVDGVVLEDSLLVVVVEDESCFEEVGEVVLCGVEVEDGVELVEELGGGVVDEGVVEESADVVDALDPAELLTPPVIADTIPPRRPPPSLLDSCRRKLLCESTKFACAMVKSMARMESNRR